MKRQWQVRRTTVMHVNGQQRWDQAYQHLLRWACPDQSGPITPSVPRSRPPQEVKHARSDLCASIDLAPSPTSDD
jgi:hypothetical protein